MEPRKILSISAKAFQMLMTIFVFWLIIIVAADIICEFGPPVIVVLCHENGNSIGTQVDSSKTAANLRELRELCGNYAASSFPIAGELIDEGFLKNWGEGTSIRPFFKKIILLAGKGDLSKKLIVTAVLVLLALWHGWARRTTQAKFILWLVFIGLFNLAGFLTYLALNHTAVIKCPACGKKRNLERSDCVRCGDNLPKISPKPLILSQK